MTDNNPSFESDGSPSRHQDQDRINSTRVLEKTGSVLRYDDMTGTWVVFARGRAERPRQTTTASLKEKTSEMPAFVSGCPFCNTDQTPKTLMRHNQMRVVPNKYPAVDPMVVSPRKSTYQPDCAASLHTETPAVGFHEVVIESPRHNAHMAHDVQQCRDLLHAFRQRGKAHHINDGIEHTCYFKNHGATAGASLHHPHAQIVSTPVVPIEAQRLQHLALSYFQKHQSSLYERVIQEELALHFDRPDVSRIVEVTQHFLAIVPYASMGPYVVVIFPRFGDELLSEKVDCSDFTSTSDILLEECSEILHSCLYRIMTLLDDPCFNLVVQSSPVSSRGVQAAYRTAAFFRWHIRITPRLGAGAMAGFELGSGFFSNSHMPEEDAKELRDIKPLILNE
ncbi:hypothetical protein ACHAWF_001406 [Thalassiosira exigua]